ncbi:MAG TPA: hypothetical protein VGM05_22090 [Planctomycetaceae bacterium]|jgi:CRISPR type IV-associated protein Csf1
MTTPQLFAKAHGNPVTPGGIQCALCYGSCAAGSPVADVLSDSFTGFARVRGETLCDGCMMTLRAENREDQPRLYSWVLTDLAKKRYTKANLFELSAACINPPDPPYSIVLATSGQKHLLYLAPVNLSRDAVTVMLEQEQVTFRPPELADRLELCKRIAAACGKPALADSSPIRLAIALPQYFTKWESILEEWEAVGHEPLSRLSAWLCPNMERSQHEYPTDIASAASATERRRIPATTGGIDGPGLFGG